MNRLFMVGAVVSQLIGGLSCSSSPVEFSVGPEGKPGIQGPAGPTGPQGPAGPMLPISGARLKAQWYSGADGSRDFQHTFYDVGQDIVCSWQVVNGVSYCLPPIRSALYFKDAQCNDPAVGFVPDVCWSIDDEPDFVRAGAGCGGVGTIYHRGDLISPPAFIYKKEGNSCVGNSLPNGWVMFDVGAPVDLSKFVVGEIMSEIPAL